MIRACASSSSSSRRQWFPPRSSRSPSSATTPTSDAVKAALFALSTSPHLASGNLAAFHAQGVSAMKDQTFVNLILTDENGRQLLNTLRTFGEPLPAQGDPGGMLRVFGVPVRGEGKVRYGLNAGLAPERLTQLLGEQELPAGRIAVVLDRAGAIVARTHDARRWIGQKGSPELVRRSQGESREDAFDARTVEGIPVLTVFHRSALSGWTVAIGIPVRELVVELGYSMARLFVVGFIALVAALGLALALGRRFLRPRETWTATRPSTKASISASSPGEDASSNS